MSAWYEAKALRICERQVVVDCQTGSTRLPDWMRERIEARRGAGDGEVRGGERGKVDLSGADLSMLRPVGVRSV
jgi:hypothetical protein